MNYHNFSSPRVQFIYSTCELLTCMREAENDADPYSVAMINSSMTVVGHESMSEEGTLEDSAPCGFETEESHLK